MECALDHTTGYLRAVRMPLLRPHPSLARRSGEHKSLQSNWKPACRQLRRISPALKHESILFGCSHGKARFVARRSSTVAIIRHSQRSFVSFCLAPKTVPVTLLRTLRTSESVGSKCVGCSLSVRVLSKVPLSALAAQAPTWSMLVCSFAAIFEGHICPLRHRDTSPPCVLIRANSLLNFSDIRTSALTHRPLPSPSVVSPLRLLTRAHQHPLSFCSHVGLQHHLLCGTGNDTLIITVVGFS